METIKEILDNYSFIRSLTGNLENFHNTFEFPHQKHFCDIYFTAPKKHMKQDQLDRFNSFVNEYTNYLKEINEFILSNLNVFEQNSVLKIKDSTIEFNVIDIPQIINKYDFVLVGSKRYKWFLFKREIGFRAEFKNGRIISIKRCKGCYEEN